MFELAEKPNYNNLSKFPQEIDTFITHQDVGSKDIEKMNRYQQLLASGSSSSEMTNLLEELQNKLFTADDINKLQDCVRNVEMYFEQLTVEDIKGIFAEYDATMNEYANDIAELKEDINTAIETKIKVAEDALDEIVATKDDTIASMFNSQYFNFDNLNYMTGLTRKTEYTSDTVTTETISNTNTGKVFATRTTTKTGTNAYTIVTVCNEVEPKVNTKVQVSKDANGNWIEKVVSG